MIFFDFLAYVQYAIVCFFCIRIANKVAKTKISITSIFALPYFLICSMQEIICIVFDYFELPNFEYWIINMLFVLATCGVELLLCKFSYICQIRDVSSGYLNQYKLSVFFIILASLLILCAAINSVMMVNTIDINMLLQDEFQDDFEESSSGNFYVRLFTMIMAVYFLGINKGKIGYLIGCFCFVPHIIINTKGILFIIIIAVFIARLLTGRIHNVKRTVLILGGCGFSIFFFSYMMEFSLYGENPLIEVDRWVYIFEKLIAYLLSGVQEFFVNLRDGIVHNKNLDNITLTPFYNLFAKFGIGTSISSVNQEIYRCIGDLPHYGLVYSNVNGYIGTLYIFNGLIGGLLYHVSIITLTFAIRLKVCICKRPFWIILYSLFSAGLFLAWFEFYFMHTFWIYFILIVFVADYLSRLNIKKNKWILGIV